MSLVSLSKHSLSMYTDEILQKLELAVKKWSRVQHEDEKVLLAQKIMKQAHRLVLLERFLVLGDNSVQKTTHMENLQKVCKALVQEVKEPEKKEKSEKEKEALLVYFYRLFYQRLRAEFTYSVLCR